MAVGMIPQTETMSVDTAVDAGCAERFVCSEPPNAPTGNVSWRSAVFRGSYIDASGVARPALVKAFRTPAMLAREVRGLAIAELLGIGPKAYMPAGVRWPKHGSYCLPDGPIDDTALMVCEEDAGVSLRAVLDARWAGTDGVDAVTKRLASLSDESWEALCAKVLLDLCEQVRALQEGRGRMMPPLVHGDIKPDNVCVRLYGEAGDGRFDPRLVRATLIDFEGVGPATLREAARRPITPRYGAYLVRTAAPREYDLGCIALLFRELTCGPLPAAEAFCDWAWFNDAPTRAIFRFVQADGRYCGVGDARELANTVGRLAGKLGLVRIDEFFDGGKDATHIRDAVRDLTGGRTWMDMKDLAEVGGRLCEERADHVPMLALAIYLIRERATGRYIDEGLPVPGEMDSGRYEEAAEQAQEWLVFLTRDLGLVLARSGEERGARVERFSAEELAQLELLECTRRLRAAREAEIPFALTERDGRLIEDAHAANLQDGSKAAGRMPARPSLERERIRAARLMARKTAEKLIDTLSELGLSLFRS